MANNNLGRVEDWLKSPANDNSPYVQFLWCGSVFKLRRNRIPQFVKCWNNRFLSEMSLPYDASGCKIDLGDPVPPAHDGEPLVFTPPSQETQAEINNTLIYNQTSSYKGDKLNVEFIKPDNLAGESDESFEELYLKFLKHKFQELAGKDQLHITYEGVAPLEELKVKVSVREEPSNNTIVLATFHTNFAT